MKRYLTLSYWKGQRLLLLVFLCLHVIVSSIYITWQNVTFDERDYFAYSIKWLHGDVERDKQIYDSKSPITIVAAFPRIVRQLIDPLYKSNDEGISDLLAGRYMMVIFTLIIAVYLFKWIRRLFGEKSWVIPLLFFLFDPLVIGYSMIITSDMASGACLLATSYHLFSWYRQRGQRQLIVFSLWLGVSFVCKASLLYFLPYLFVLGIVIFIFSKLHFRWETFLISFFIVSSVSMLVVNAAYFGKGSFRSLSASSFQSSSFKRLAASPLIKDIPVPLPYSYVQSLDMLQHHGEIGAGHAESTHHGTYIGEKERYQGGFWYYYLYTGLYKIPIATLILFVAGFFISLAGFRNQFLIKHLWYVLPFIFFFIVLSVFNPFQTGFRHILLVYPLCFLFLAAAVSVFQKRFTFGTLGSSTLLAYMIVSTAFFYPWIIPYTNELLASKKSVFRKIKDSTLDYGHNVYQVRRFLKKNPGYQTAPFEPGAGKFIVPAFQLVPYPDRENASWLTAFEPVDHYQFSMFLFNISEENLRLVKK